MDAHQFGTFIADCRKEMNMTQADLAAKIQVTDKAVSRWERGVGFPDINTIEPLADALGISVMELMRSERMQANEMTNQQATELITDTLNVARQQYRQQQREILRILGIVFAVVVVVLFLDHMQGQMDSILFFGAGVVFPLFCLGGFVGLFGYGIWCKRCGKPCRQIFMTAFALLFLLALFFGLFFLIGLLGIGPIPD